MACLPKSLQDYIKLTAPEDITTLIRPLTNQLGINYFLFIREFNNGNRIWLTNNGPWEEHFHKKEYYRISAFENPQEQRFTGIYPWYCLKGQEVFNDARKSFNINNGITILEKSQEKSDFFHFAVPYNNIHGENACAENIEILRLFINFFRDQAKGLITLAEKNMINIAPPTAPLQLKKTQKTYDIKSFALEITPARHYLSDDDKEVYLTQKEMECIQWCIHGKSSEEIAMILGVSKRTVEAHLENMKQKLNCYKQFQLGYKLGKSSLFQ